MSDRIINFTDRRLADLRPDPTGKRYAKHDRLTPGLVVIIGKKRKSFGLLRRFPGSRNPTRRYIGEVGSVTIDEARAIARDWTAMVKRGIEPAIERKAREEQQRKAREAEIVRQRAAVQERRRGLHCAQDRQAAAGRLRHPDHSQRAAAGVGSDCEFIFCGGGAKPDDTHLLVTIHAVDDEIIEWLERRERRKCLRANPNNRHGHREADTHSAAEYPYEIQKQTCSDSS